MIVIFFFPPLSPHHRAPDPVGGNLVEGFFAGEDLRVGKLVFGVLDAYELGGHRGAAEETAENGLDVFQRLGHVVAYPPVAVRAVGVEEDDYG